MSRTLLAWMMAALLVPCALESSDRVKGEASDFRSTGGKAERCVRIAPFPGGSYSKGDLEDELAFCGIDLYAEDVALCPKTWSTSPGMVIHDLTEGPYARDRGAFQRHACTEGKSAQELSGGVLAKFKPTLNAPGTSGTFSTSSLLYYHFSRYLGTEVKVPVAVWRSIDREAFFEQVAEPGLASSGHGHSSQMNHVGWQVLAKAAQDPASYRPTGELFSSDRQTLYGVLLTSPGHRYNSEVNGTRKSGWGKGQNRDFQETAPFLALRSSQPLREAIREGLETARRDPQLRRDMGSETSELQMVYWMREISEIVLLDYIFSQQDRIGNIDFKTHWIWAEAGEVRHQKVDHHEPRATPPAEGALKIKRTHLNDNDAGGRLPYANFTKSTQMVEKLRHFSADVYRSLLELHGDFEAAGPLYSHAKTSFGLDDRQLDQLVTNTRLVAAILRATCERGELRFDLDPETFVLEGDVPARQTPCGMD